MTKAINKNEGKPKWSLLLTDFAEEMEELLRCRKIGAKKYGRRNATLEKDYEFYEDNLDSIERHLMALRKGEKQDKESGCHHLAHVALRALIGMK